jgi:heme d1 biosynthesis radical SAM protein NirJ
MQEINSPTPVTEPRQPKGPVVIWNLIRRCNLTCKHCYSISADIDFPGELDTTQVFSVMDDLRSYGVPVLILSGGEPLLRPDIFEVSRRAREMGFYVGLSTNGTLIGEHNIERIADIGYDYVGVSLDGTRATHDHFRQKEGAYDKSLTGIRLCRDYGIKVGMRFSITQNNAAELPLMLKLMEQEGVDKFYLSHLNYGGRGHRHRTSDVAHNIGRQAMDLMFDTCWDDMNKGGRREFVSGNNDADGVYFLHWVKRRFPDHYDHLLRKLRQWGGNSSGVNIANIDNVGNVHPDTFWWNYNLGNVKERPFSEIWPDTSDPIMAGLKSKPRPLRGRCGVCTFQDVCGGNTRVRAFQTTGDPWAEDPACYLSDAELGIEPEQYVNDGPVPMDIEKRRVRFAG